MSHTKSSHTNYYTREDDGKHFSLFQKIIIRKEDWCRDIKEATFKNLEKG